MSESHPSSKYQDRSHFFHKQDDAEEDLEHAIEKLEGSVETGATVCELVNNSQECIKRINDIAMATQNVSTTPIEVVTPLTETLRAIPLVSDFIRGLVDIREAVVAYRSPDPHFPQRKTKIGAGIFGAVVSIGSGIVGALLLAGVGLLGTAAALYAAPIVLAALTVGVYSVALYRDVYSFYQLRKQRPLLSAKITDELRSIDEKILEIKSEANKPADNDPRLMDLHAEKAQLEHASLALAHAYGEARKKVFFSALMVIGVGIAVGAVAMTGIGALVLGGIAAAIVVGATLGKLINRHISQFKHKVEGTPHDSKGDNPKEFSTLHVDKVILHDDHEKIKEVLKDMHEEKAAQEDSIIKKENVSQDEPSEPVTELIKQLDEAAEGDETKPPESPHSNNH